MTWAVRPVESIEDYAAALGAIGHYFGGWPPDLERAQQFARTLPLERDARGLRDGDKIVGGAGAFPFRFTVPGGASTAPASPLSVCCRHTAAAASSAR